MRDKKKKAKDPRKITLRDDLKIRGQIQRYQCPKCGALSRTPNANHCK